MLDLVDKFGANFVIYVMAMVEVGAIAWIYGLNNLLDDIEFMSGRRPGWYWKACWGFVIPVGLFVILVYSRITESEVTSGEDGNTPFPRIAIGMMRSHY
jgi:solute carrier family 6 amino acid transporter-like protein 5/7/9/14